MKLNQTKPLQLTKHREVFARVFDMYCKLTTVHSAAVKKRTLLNTNKHCVSVRHIDGKTDMKRILKTSLVLVRFWRDTFP